jgi:hypothetical protein
MNVLRTLALVAVAAAIGGSAGAQTIYRCGNEYTTIPCAGGRALETVGDTRSAAQRAEARRIMAEEERKAREMERDRHRNEATIKPAAATSLSAPQAAANAASAPKKTTKKSSPKKPHKYDDDRDFVASVPAGTKSPERK